MSKKPPGKIGHYPILKELGRGTSAIVYLADDPFKGAPVAVKVANLDSLHDANEERIYRKLFLNEASLAGKLSHPNICLVHDAVVDEDHAYLVMEYVAGGTLKKFCHPGRLLPVRRAIEVMFRACWAMDYAYQNGVIHRDLKSSNILLTDGGDIKISDFGCAHINYSQQTQVTGIIGSPAYMSPEQITDNPATTQADIYSLGVVMYELLTGRLPFQANSTASLIHKILHEDPAPVRDHRTGVPTHLELTVARALAKDPKHRYRTWRDFGRDLVDAFMHLDPFEDRQTDADRLATLRGVEFFRSFADSDLAEMLKIVSWERLRPGAMLVPEPDSFVVLIAGRAQLPDGEEVKAGDSYGECVIADPDESDLPPPAKAQTEVHAVRIKLGLLSQASAPLQLQVHKTFLRRMARSVR